MKIYRLVAIAIAMLFAQPALAQEAAWGVNFQNQVFRLDSLFKQVPGSLKQVSVGADGAVWGVDPNDNVLRWTGSQWQLVQGTNLKQLSVRNAQEVWGVNAADDLFRWNGSAWEQPIRSKLAYVSVGADGRLCGIGTTDGLAYCRDDSTWTLISAQGQQFRRISVTNRQRVLGIDTSGNLLRWTGAGWEVVLPGKGNRTDAFELIDAVETTDGKLWTVYENGYFMWKRGNSQGTFVLIGANDQPIPDGLRQIAAVSPLALPAGLTAEQQQMLDAHNRERQNNFPGVGPLQWSPGLAQAAQEWAEGRAREGNLNHRQNMTNPFKPGEWVGENIYWSSNTAATGADAVRWWIDEKQWYHYDQDRDGMGASNQPPGCTIVWDSAACRERQGNCVCGHFTQVIWKNTQYLGCGKATAADGSVYSVCNYYPGGNITGQKPY